MVRSTKPSAAGATKFGLLYLREKPNMLWFRDNIIGTGDGADQYHASRMRMSPRQFPIAE